MPSIFFGSKISGLCIFWGLQYEAPSDPSVMYTSSNPLDTHSILIAILDWRRVPVFIKTLKNCAKQESVYFVIYPKQGPKMEAVVLNRVGNLGPFCPKQGQGLRPSAAPLYTNMGQEPQPPGFEQPFPILDHLRVARKVNCIKTYLLLVWMGP